jgi:hypothetical protein
MWTLFVAAAVALFAIQQVISDTHTFHTGYGGNKLPYNSIQIDGRVLASPENQFN